MHPDANTSQSWCKLFGMSRRRQRRRSAEAKREAPRAPDPFAERVVAREAPRVVRLAYTRRQAAEALGISSSTFNRRVLPLIETLSMGWGTRLIPVDELERLLAERRQPARLLGREAPSLGRRRAVPDEVVARIRAEHTAGISLSQIARDLNASGVRTGEAIQEAVRSGRQVKAVNKATGNTATRYIHPKTGKSVVVDNVTGEVIHVGGPGFKYGPGSGDLP